MFSLPVWYCVCLFAVKVGSNVISPPSQPPSLTFQVEPDTIPSSDHDSWETWPGDALSSHQAPSSDHEFDAAFNPLQQHQLLSDRPLAPPTVWYNAFLPVPVGLPFFNLFQNAPGRLLSLAVANNALDIHHHLPEPIDCSKYTIGEVLEWTLLHTPKPSGDYFHHPPPLHRFAWLVNMSHPVREALKNPDADFTVFASDDKALTPPRERKHYPVSHQLEDDEATQDSQVTNNDDSHIFWDALEAVENHSGCAQLRQVEENDDDKEKKRKKFLHVIEAVLKYHILPGRKTLREIVDSSTLPTELPVMPEPEAARFRVRFEAFTPHLRNPGNITLNFFSKYDVFKTRPIVTKNGIIYIIEKVPLLPPLSPLSSLFMFPHATSTLTSALQKTHLDDVLLPHWGNKTIPLSANSNLDLSSSLDDILNTVDERVQSVLSSLLDGHGGKLKKESFTVFTPTNAAFESLGRKANAFLFSPFGEHILRYVLSYHIVPHLIWHTDHCNEIKNGQTTDCDLVSKTYQMIEPLPPLEQLTIFKQYAHPHHPLPPLPGKANITELFLPTLLGSRANESLPISLVEFRHFGKGPIIRRVYIKQNKKDFSFGSPDKHAIPVIVPDAVAWGGAIHTIHKLIHPPIPEGHRKRKDVQRAVELSILTPA